MPDITLTSSASFQISSPTVSVKVVEDSYVTSIATCPTSQHYAVALSSPASLVSLHDPQTLSEVQSWRAHSDGITQLSYSQSGDLISSGKDGCIQRWDDRVGNGKAMTMTAPYPVLTFDAEDNIIVGGTELCGEESHIIYWDIRNPSKFLRVHSSTHSDDITMVRFIPYPGVSPVLLSTSTDGLLSLSNSSEDDEDDATFAVANWGTSIAQAGVAYDGQDPIGLWSSSDMETMALWNFELDRQDFGDVRKPRAALRTQGNRDWKMDYLINVISPSWHSKPVLLGGTNAGDVGLIDFAPLEPQNWSLTGVLRGHRSVVRCGTLDIARNVLLTGGEDASLAAWLIGENNFDSSAEISLRRKRSFDDTAERVKYKAFKTRAL